MADELVTVDASVYLLMAMVGWVGIGKEVVDGMHVGQSQEGLVACLEIQEYFPSAM